MSIDDTTEREARRARLSVDAGSLKPLQGLVPSGGSHSRASEYSLALDIFIIASRARRREIAPGHSCDRRRGDVPSGVASLHGELVCTISTDFFTASRACQMPLQLLLSLLSRPAVSNYQSCVSTFSEERSEIRAERPPEGQLFAFAKVFASSIVLGCTKLVASSLFYEHKINSKYYANNEKKQKLSLPHTGEREARGTRLSVDVESLKQL